MGCRVAVGVALLRRALVSKVLQHFPDRYEDEIEELRVKFHQTSRDEEMKLGIAARQRSRYLRFARPPQEKQLIAARKQTMKEKKLARLFTEILVSSLLLTLLLIMVSCELSLLSTSCELMLQPLQLMPVL